MFNVLVDRTAKLGDNDHALQPDPKKATLPAFGAAHSFLKSEGHSIPDLGAKEKAIPNGWPDE
jgi:hypothetical protein